MKSSSCKRSKDRSFGEDHLADIDGDVARENEGSIDKIQLRQ